MGTENNVVIEGPAVGGGKGNGEWEMRDGNGGGRGDRRDKW